MVRWFRLAIYISAFSMCSCSTAPASINKRLASLEPIGQHHASLVAFTRSTNDVRIDSVVRFQGGDSRSGPPAPLIKKGADWGSLEILAPPADVEFIMNALELNADSLVWLTAAVASVGRGLSWSSQLTRTPIHLQVIVVAEGASYFYRHSASTEDDFLSLAVGISVDASLEMPAVHWYSSMVRTVLHELSHVSIYFNETAGGNRPEQHNEEAAAYLVGHCATILLARELGMEVGMDFEIDRSEHYLTRDLIYRPNREVLEEMDPSIAGWGMAAALLISEIATSFSSEHEAVDRIVLPACSSVMAGSVPDFMSGVSLVDLINDR